MIITMAGQLKQLAAMMICGFLLALAYDLIRFFRRAVPHNNIFIALEDMVFWPIAAVITFLAILWLDFGQIRGFMLMGEAMGAVVYYVLISAVFLKISMFLFCIAKKMTGILLYPFWVTLSTVRSIFEYFVNFLKKLLQNLLSYGKIKIAFVKGQIASISKNRGNKKWHGERK